MGVVEPSDRVGVNESLTADRTGKAVDISLLLTY